MMKIMRTPFNHHAFSTLIFSILAIALLFSGCEGDQGPAGPPGPEILPVSFEFEASLNEDNNFEFLQAIPAEIEVFDSDVVLVFVLEDFIEEDDLEVWRQLPITEFNERGTLILNFDFTLVDVRLFFDANYQLGAVDELNNVIFRGVHVPSDFIANAQVAGEVAGAATIPELEKILDTKIKSIKKATSGIALSNVNRGFD